MGCLPPTRPCALARVLAEGEGFLAPLLHEQNQKMRLCAMCRVASPLIPGPDTSTNKRKHARFWVVNRRWEQCAASRKKRGAQNLYSSREICRDAYHSPCESRGAPTTHPHIHQPTHPSTSSRQPLQVFFTQDRRRSVPPPTRQHHRRLWPTGRCRRPVRHWRSHPGTARHALVYRRGPRA